MSLLSVPKIVINEKHLKASLLYFSVFTSSTIFVRVSNCDLLLIMLQGRQSHAKVISEIFKLWSVFFSLGQIAQLELHVQINKASVHCN